MEGFLFVSRHFFVSCDSWTWEQAKEYFEGVLAIQHEFPTLPPLLHETHRGRIMYNPWISQRVLEAFPTLSITADLSHWVVVCERHLDNEEFGGVMNLVSERATHIHARPSSTQCIQLSSVFDPFFASDLESFRGYWRKILLEQKKLGKSVVTVDPEFGPPPYGLVRANSEGTLQIPLEESVDNVVEIFRQLASELEL